MAVPGLGGYLHRLGGYTHRIVFVLVVGATASFLLAEARGSPAGGRGRRMAEPNRVEPNRVEPNRAEPNRVDQDRADQDRARCEGVDPGGGAGAHALLGPGAALDAAGNAGALGDEASPQSTRNGKPRARIHACPTAEVSLLHGTVSIELNGHASEDGDGGAQGLTYAWRKVHGPSGDVLDAPRSPLTRVTFRAAGTFRYELTVDDGQETDGIASSELEIRVNEPDCNSNGVPDSIDIRDGTSRDCNRNGIPDECDFCGSYLSLPVSAHPIGSGERNAIDAVVLDANRDGQPDIVSLNRDSSDLVVLLGDGKGTFLPAGAFPVGGKPWRAVSADFDGDGAADIASANRESGNVAVVAGVGDGTFMPPRLMDPGFAPWGIAQGDLDGDGDPDIVVVGGVDGFRVFLNDGFGRFIPGLRGSAAYPNCVATGDVDGDGDIDIVVGSGPTVLNAPAVAVFLNRGYGIFDGPIVASTQSVPVDIALADLDGDGDLDVAYAPRGPAEPYGRTEILTLVNDGKGGLLRGSAIPVPYYPHTVAAADLDGDGDLDLATASEANGIVTLMCNEGDGTFRKCIGHFVGGSAFRIAVEDLDGDGDPDVVMACGHDDKVAIVWNNCSVVSTDCNENDVPDECDWANGIPGACAPQQVFFLRGDVDADGKVSISDAVSVLRHLFGGSEAPSCEKSADANDDGELDLADPIHLLVFLAQGGDAVPLPYPFCGPDFTHDALTCESFPPCTILPEAESLVR